MKNKKRKTKRKQKNSLSCQKIHEKKKYSPSAKKFHQSKKLKNKYELQFQTTFNHKKLK
jgi:hypothetical protein